MAIRQMSEEGAKGAQQDTMAPVGNRRAGFHAAPQFVRWYWSAGLKDAQACASDATNARLELQVCRPALKIRLTVALPDPPRLSLEQLCIADSERTPIPEAPWSGREGWFPSCGLIQAFLDSAFLSVRRCGDEPRPRRSAPRPTYFPNLWPCFYLTLVGAIWEVLVQIPPKSLKENTCTDCIYSLL